MTGPTDQLIAVDPRTLTAHPANVRADLRDLKTLAASIKAVGLMQPIVVAPDGAAYRTIAGPRRTAACILAGLDQVDALVRSDLVDQPGAQLMGNLVENLGREDLNAGELAAGIAQLTAFSMTPTAIGKATGLGTATVKTHLRVARSATAVAAVTRFDLTLEQAVVLAEFDVMWTLDQGVV